MPTQQMEAVALECEDDDATRPERLTEAVLGVCAAIDRVKMNMERFISRAAEVLR